MTSPFPHSPAPSEIGGKGKPDMMGRSRAEPHLERSAVVMRAKQTIQQTTRAHRTKSSYNRQEEEKRGVMCKTRLRQQSNSEAIVWEIRYSIERVVSIRWVPFVLPIQSRVGCTLAGRDNVELLEGLRGAGPSTKRGRRQVSSDGSIKGRSGYHGRER